MALINIFSASFVLLCVVHGGLFKELPSYIQICKRDANTLEDCVIKSIEAMKPQLISGIPEIEVPSVDPFFITEIKALSSNNLPLQAYARNMNVTGASAFTIKSLSVDIDTLLIKTRLRFPKLHFEGDYELDTQLMVLPLKGKGKVVADAVKCEAEFTFHTKIFTRDGVEYIKFKKIETDVTVKDYKIKLEGLFNGDKALGEAANAAINQNRGEFIKQIKPSLDKTISKLFLNIANKIVDGFTLDQLLPKP